MDAAHCVFAPVLGMIWCFTRLFVKAPAGRQRLNVLAAVNATTHELFTVAKLTDITAETVCELLRLLASAYQGLPITIMLDNARYQRCALVQSVAETVGIDLLFLPAYAPTLNLIERFWRFVKEPCLDSKYYPDSTAFQTRDPVVYSQRTNGAPSRVKSAVNLTLPNVPRRPRDWRTAHNFQEVEENSLIEGRVEYIIIFCVAMRRCESLRHDAPVEQNVPQ
jgi:DDE superfamily endonuclease